MRCNNKGQRRHWRNNTGCTEKMPVSTMGNGKRCMTGKKEGNHHGDKKKHTNKTESRGVVTLLYIRGVTEGIQRSTDRSNHPPNYDRFWYTQRRKSNRTTNATGTSVGLGKQLRYASGIRDEGACILGERTDSRRRDRPAKISQDDHASIT